MSLLKLRLREVLADLIEVAPEEISMTADLGDLGVDSLIALRLARKIADVTGREIELEWLFDHSTIEQLATFLEAQGVTSTMIPNMHADTEEAA